MAIPLLILLPLLVIITGIAYFALQDAIEAWLKPLLQWLFAPRQSFWKRVLLWPVKEIGKGLAAVVRYVKRVLGGAAFLAASAVAHFLMALAWVIELRILVAERFAKAVYNGFVYLRNVAIPTLIELVLKPVRADAATAKALALGAVSTLTAVSVEIAKGIAFLPGVTPLGLPARVAAWLDGFRTLWDKVFKDLAPKLTKAITVTIPKLAGEVDDIFTDLYKTGAKSLPGIRTRLADLEKALVPILSNPLAWLAALLGSVAGIAMLTTVLAKVAPQLFCKNTTGAAKRLCAFDETLFAQLLAGTLAFALVIDPRALAKVAEGVTVALDTVVRETALR